MRFHRFPSLIARAHSPVIAEFSLHVADLGFRTDGPLHADGRIHRVNWKPGSGTGKPGWYVAFADGDAGTRTVVWGDYREAWRDVWSSKASRRMSGAERASFAAQTAKAKEMEEREHRKSAESAERRTMLLWANSEIDVAEHAYLTKKQIGAECLRSYVHDGRVEILVPLRDAIGNLCNLQRIRPDGSKRFVKGGGTAGLSWRLGPAPPEDWTGNLCVTEGVATAGTVRKMSGATVFAAMNANNLPTIVKWMRKKWPISRIMIAADDDRWERDGTPRPAEKNVGRVKATEAAEGTRALIILPGFGNLQSRGTDWNDLWCEEGEAMARNKWTTAVTLAGLDRQVATMSDAEYGRRKTELQNAYAAAGSGRIGARELDQRRRGTRAEGAVEDGSDERPPGMVIAQICEDVEIWQDQFGVAYGTFLHDQIRLNATIEGTFFRDWLRIEFAAATNSETPPSREILKSWVEEMAARARLSSNHYQSCYRMSFRDGFHWLDLGRDDWKMVKWNADGWAITTDCPVKFVHANEKGSLPVPMHNPKMNGLDPLWEIINVAEEDRCLIAGWLLSAMLSTAPVFGLSLYGAQGTAKSYATSLLRCLLDPKAAMFQKISERDVDNLGITCIQQWIPCFENMSRLDSEVQDAFCSLTTKLSIRKRKLYADGDVFTCEVRRPWIINGINNVCSRGDLAQRSIPVCLLPGLEGENRKKERFIDEKYEACRPHVMAILLDAAASACKFLPLAEDFLKRNKMNHRMADALEWITAGEDTLGFPMGTFITRLNKLQDDAGYEALDGNPVVNTILSLVNASSRGYWKGTHDDILSAMHEAYPMSKREKYLPHDSVSMGNWLRRECERLMKSFGLRVGDRKKVQEAGHRVWKREIQLITAPENDSDPD